MGSVLQQFVSAVQCHPRSFMLVPTESAYATSYWSVVVTLVLSCTVSEILQVFVLMISYSTLILVVFSLDQITHIGVSPSRNLKIISREIIFKVFQPL